jgi:hypothetical protein
MARSWAEADPWLLVGGVTAIPAGLAVRRLRPLAGALLIQVLMMLRGGYLPFGYVIGMLPFCALLLAGAGDVLTWRASGVAIRIARSVALVAVLTAFAALALPAWAGDLRHQATVDGSANSRAATKWVTGHVAKDALVVTDDYIWLDLTLQGFRKPVWFWKVDTDPEVMHQLLPAGYLSIDYIVLADPGRTTLASLPTLEQGMGHSEVVATFGEVVVRRVTKRQGGRS